MNKIYTIWFETSYDAQKIIADRIKGLGDTYRLDKFYYLLSTEIPIKEIYNKVQRDEHFRIVIGEISDMYGWHCPAVWSWIDKQNIHFKSCQKEDY